MLTGISALLGADRSVMSNEKEMPFLESKSY
jgi:hypothetical protein